MDLKSRGFVLAILLVAVAAMAAALVLWRGGALKPTETSQVVVAFAMAGEDEAMTAQMIVVVDPATGNHRIEDAMGTVSIPGSSYTQLRDAYPLGGAAAVASVLDGGAADPGTAWVDVSQEAWERLLAGGIEVTITESFETYDDTADRYTEFVEGPQHVASKDLRGLMNGALYLQQSARDGILREVAAASLSALASAQPGRGIETDLDDRQWAALVQELAAAAR